MKDILYLNMIEIFRDKLALTEVYKTLKNNYNEKKYQNVQINAQQL